jgi:hypothetical protein
MQVENPERSLRVEDPERSLGVENPEHRLGSGSPDRSIGAVNERSLRVEDPERSFGVENSERSLGVENPDHRLGSLLQESGKELPAYVPKVSIITKKGARNIEIRVKDNGEGIPESNLEKIFHPFFTTKPTGQGTGLGLSLAYDIVTKGHGGSLKVVSEVGAGTEFIIELPLDQ